MMEKQRQADTDFPETATRGEVVPQAPRASARLPLSIGQKYERFLELQPALVLLAMWAAGAALLGLTGLALYSIAWMLVRSVAGSV